MPRTKCFSWGHFEEESASSWKCKHCSSTVSTNTATRLKAHLFSCADAKKDSEVKEQAKKAGDGKRRQAALITVPGVSEPEKKRLRTHWATFFLATGTPFSVCESPYFQEALAATRPGLVTPEGPPLLTRRDLAGAELDAAYDTAMRNTEVAPGTFVTLHMDAWKTGRKTHVLTCVLMTPSGPVTIGTRVLEERHHDAKELFDAVLGIEQVRAAVAGEEGAPHIGAVVSDGGSASLKAAKDLAENLKCPVVLCVPHTINRALCDVVGVYTKSKKECPRPFNFLDKWVRRLCSALRNQEALGKLLFAAQKQAGRKPKLPPMPNETRWTSTASAWEAILEEKTTFLLMLSDEATNSELVASLPEIKKVEDGAWWELFVPMCSLVCLLRDAVDFMQADKSDIAWVIPVMYTIKKRAQDLTTQFQGDDKKRMREVAKLLEKRVEQYLAPWIVATTFLTPHLIAQEEEEEGDVTETASSKFHVAFAEANKEDNNLKKMATAYIKEEGGAFAAAEFLAYLNETGDIYGDDIVMSLRKVESAKGFWQVLRKEYPQSKLPPIALSIVSITPSNAMVERVFSTMGWLSGGRRSRMLEERAHRATVVFSYYRRKKKQKPGEGVPHWWTEQLEEDPAEDSE